MLRIANLNCNGIRSALQKGLASWLTNRRLDILCLQEVRAFPADLGDWAEGPHNWHAYWHPATKPGYSGVALLSRKPADTVSRFGHRLFDEEGRWLEAHFGELTVISLYLPSGTSSTERQQVKFRCLELLYRRLAKLRRCTGEVIVTGDLNIAHTKKDLKNWKGNLNNSGFLPEEREWMDKVTEQLGWVDVQRRLDQSEGLYSWWARRGNCRERNVGWRIDYQLATPGIASAAMRAAIDTQPVLSDHAPVVIDYVR